MGFNVELNRDQKRLAEAKARDLPNDHPLRTKYFDWINELDRLLRSHQNESYLPEVSSRTPSSEKTLVVESGQGDRRKSTGAALNTHIAKPHRLTQVSSHRPMAAAQSKASSSVRSGTRKESPVASMARSDRHEQLLRENRILQQMLARYSQPD